jgi:hypothetical protein
MITKQAIKIAIAAGLGLVFIQACGEKSDDDSPVNPTNPNPNPTPSDDGGDPVVPGTVGTLLLNFKADSDSGPGFSLNQRSVETLVSDTLSFTPTSFKLPIMKITITKSDGSDEQNIYKCANDTEAECLVDLADQTALNAVATTAGKASIRVGEYERLSLYTCAEGASGTTSTIAYVTGSATFQTQNWRTDSTAATGIDKSGTGTASETQVGNWACSTKNVLLKPAATIAADTEIKLSIVVDNTFAAQFGTLISSGKGGCKTEGSSGDGLCVTYPAILPYVGSDAAVMKRFLITHHEADTVAAAAFDDTKANALVLVGTDAAGKGFMALGRELYTETSAQPTNNEGAALDLTYGGPTYITSTNFATFVANANGSIAFEQGGTEDANAAVFTEFKLEAHEGLVKTKNEANTWSYRAIVLD